MKNLIATCFCSLLFLSSYGQFVESVDSVFHLQTGEKIWKHTEVENLASFPNGTDAVLRWLYGNIMYPPYARENGIEGIVIASVIIEKDGKVNDPIIIKSPHESISSEVIRVIAEMPDWEAAEFQGEKVRCQVLVPVKFRLVSKEPKFRKRKSKSEP